MNYRGIGGFLQPATAEMVNDVGFEVIENGVVVSCGGRRTYFADVPSATAHIAKYIEDGKNLAREARAREEEERAKWKERAADPLGGLGDPAMVEKLMGLVSTATGVPTEALQQVLRDRLGVDGWRTGEPPVS